MSLDLTVRSYQVASITASRGKDHPIVLIQRVHEALCLFGWITALSYPRSATRRWLVASKSMHHPHHSRDAVEVDLNRQQVLVRPFVTTQMAIVAGKSCHCGIKAACGRDREQWRNTGSCSQVCKDTLCGGFLYHPKPTRFTSQSFRKDSNADFDLLDID